MRSLLASLALTSLATFGCSKHVPPAPTVSLQSGSRMVSPDNPDRGEILIWVTRGEGGQTRTFRLAGEGALKVLGDEEGIIVATTHGELTWRAREKEIDLLGCEAEEGAQPLLNKGTITTADLLDPGGNVVQKVVDPNHTGGMDVDDMQHHVKLLGTVGPYFFIYEASFINACGFHGHEAASALIWDAESGKTLELWGELPDKEKLADDALRKIDKEEGVETKPDDDTKAFPAQFVPAYGDRGALRIDAQFARGACYSCSDHEWSSYTRSAVIPTNWIPERMQSWAMPPVAVKEFLEAHKEWRLGGWSRR